MLNTFRSLLRRWTGRPTHGHATPMPAPSPYAAPEKTPPRPFKFPEQIHLHWHVSDITQIPAQLTWHSPWSVEFNGLKSSPQPTTQSPAYDPHLLDNSRTQWQFGDWDSLVKLQRDSLEQHPERAKLALLAAAGHQQVGDMNAARDFVQLARDWGCDKQLISRVLVAGVYNTLGKAAAIGGQEQRAINHFENAIAVALPKSDIRLLGQTRIIRETAKLGLLPQAARLMGKELKVLKSSPNLNASRLKIFETELELLHSELSLAQQRQQLFHPSSAVINTTTAEGTPAWIASLKKKSVSQLGQDLWVLEKTGYKRNGYFVEFGATDGVLLSNTWLLEKEFGWKGICAEPNPKFFAKLKTNRQCTVSEQCISGETGKPVEFVFADAYGGSQEYAKEDMHGEKRAAYRTVGQVATLPTISLDDFLIELGAPREIDYLSVDTEGSEFEILNAFPFEKWHIRLLTIEHNFTARRADIRILMERHGYRCIEQQWDDWYELGWLK
ncbi:FkbM family methyltransferase [Methylobacter sp.]|uniref:FkbM family methyltransferase n=1 Tax=Methylobacter sp. TaxID=2051955 RepID=UPI002FDE2895